MRARVAPGTEAADRRMSTGEGAEVEAAALLLPHATAGVAASPPPPPATAPPPSNNNNSLNGSGPPYAVPVNQPAWPAARVRQAYGSNYIRTTKYTVLSFLPLNLFHQFSRFYNLYFLLTAILSLAFPEASPINPFLTVFPLALVLTVTALKDAFEDWIRYRSDRRANAVPCEAASHGGAFRPVRSQDLRPGDLVRVRKEEAFPVDLVILASAHADGSALVQTAQLDGETNLKRRKAVLEGPAAANVDRLPQVRTHPAAPGPLRPRL
jgi:magnesium-transporting ATPase (P-type)